MNAETLDADKLRELLEAETVNSAADYFVHRVRNWREQVEVFLRGERSTLFRPTPTLFLLLKLGRMSEQDLADCRVLLDACANSSWPAAAEIPGRTEVWSSPGASPVLKLGLPAPDPPPSLRSGWPVDVARVRTALVEPRADAGSGASERRLQLARWLADFGA